MAQNTNSDQPQPQSGTIEFYPVRAYPAAWAPSGKYSRRDENIEAAEVNSNVDFNSKTIRAAFVRKVFTVITIMLIVVTVMTAIPYLNDHIMNFVRKSFWLYSISYITFFSVYIALMCCQCARRSFPMNVIAAALLTLSIGYMTMMICAYNNTISVLLGLTITTVSTAGVILFASLTKYDLTSRIGIIYIATILLLCFGFVAVLSVVIFHVRWIYTIYAGLAAAMFIVYLAFDIQVLKGRREMREEVKDWNANFEKAATILESLWNHCDSDDQRLNTVIEQYENLRKKAQISFQVFGEVAQDSAGSFDEMLQAKLKKVEEKAAVTLAEPLSFRQTSTNSDDLIAERVLFSKKDPFTMKDITQPVRNIICKHVYDEEALQHFLSTAKGHIYCPQKSCVNKKPLSMDNVTRYPDFFNFVIN